MKKIEFKQIALVLITIFCLGSCNSEDDLVVNNNDGSGNATTPSTNVSRFRGGLFLLKQNNEVDFQSNNNLLTENIFSRNNDGAKIPTEEELMEVIPHNKGFLLITNKYSHIQSEHKGFVYFLNKNFKLSKKEEIISGNLTTGKYAVIDSKVYYTTTISKITFDDPNNKAYVIDVESETIKKYNTIITQFLSDSKGNLYGTNAANHFVRVDKNNLESQVRIASFNQLMKNTMVIDKNDVVWGVYKDQLGSSFFEIIRDLIVKPLHIIRFDLNTGELLDKETTETSNTNSSLSLSNDKSEVFIALTHKENRNKSLYSLSYRNNKPNLNLVHRLPFDSKLKELHVEHISGNTFWRRTFWLTGPLSGAGLNGNNLGYYKIDGGGNTTSVDTNRSPVRRISYAK